MARRRIHPLDRFCRPAAGFAPLLGLALVALFLFGAAVHGLTGRDPFERPGAED
jgi:hypothetical protein